MFFIILKTNHNIYLLTHSLIFIKLLDEFFFLYEKLFIIFNFYLFFYPWRFIIFMFFVNYLLLFVIIWAFIFICWFQWFAWSHIIPIRAYTLSGFVSMIFIRVIQIFFQIILNKFLYKSFYIYSALRIGTFLNESL